MLELVRNTKRYCNIISVIMEIIAITLTSIGVYLEGMYCCDKYTWIITMGALIAMCGSFVQKKLPWAAMQRVCAKCKNSLSEDMRNTA